MTKIYVSFVNSKRGMPMPVINDYLFSAKNKERTTFKCTTEGCKCLIHIKKDESGWYTTDEIIHTESHSNHKEKIDEMRYRQELKEELKKRRK